LLPLWEPACSRQSQQRGAGDPLDPGVIFVCNIGHVVRPEGELLEVEVGGVVAAFFGVAWATRFSEARLRRVILIVLVLIGIALIGEAFLPGDIQGLLPQHQLIRAAASIVFGLGIGLFSSMLGVAGGEVIIPTLVFAFGVDIKTAGTASLPTVLTGIARYARRGAYTDRSPLVTTVAPMGVGSVIGAVLSGSSASLTNGAPTSGPKIAA
jgi:uncharacterized membrane protein YfcA